MFSRVCGAMNRDDGRRFTCTDRLDVIAEELRGSLWRRIDAPGLFHLYARGPLEEMGRRPVVLSTHVDVQKNITRCFSRERGGRLLGTFDNAVTNAAALFLMREGRLPDHAAVAFTGDEEEGCAGARQLSRYFRRIGIEPLVIVLDVTDMGWDLKDYFTIENNFWTRPTGMSVVSAAWDFGQRWHFVPSYVEDMPGYVDADLRIYEEAEADESWEYDEWDVECFSLCLPVSGEMHSDRGVEVRKESLQHYIRALEVMAERL